MVRATLYHVLILLFTAMTCKAAPLTDAGQALARSITILYSARANIISNHMEPLRGERSRWEDDEFRLFLSYIDGRILAYCKELRQNHGPEAIADLPCPSADAQPTDRASYVFPEKDAVTATEQTAEVETEFQASLGQFDDMLLQEQEQIARHAPKQREYPAAEAGSGSRSKPYSDDQAIVKEPGKTAGGSAKGSTRSQDMAGVESRGGGAGSTRQTRTLPSTGNKEFPEDDDDIVARQLREAAERETDPEIKARLWDEYDKYKQGIN
jgi:hypothetical protein